MRAALLEEMPGDLVVQDARLTDIGPDEVLVRTVACGLCHSDLHYIEGKIPERTPVLLGHEAAGIVDAVGENDIAIRMTLTPITSLVSSIISRKNMIQPLG